MGQPEHYKSSSGFHCMKVLYNCDPEKDSDELAKGYPGGKNSAAYRQEILIDWDAAGGELVFPQFELYRERIVRKPFTVPESWSLYAAFDYGHRNPSSFHVYAIDHDSDIWVVWEYYRSGQGFRQIAKEIRACPHYDRLAYPAIADPSIWARTQQMQSDDNEVKSIAQLFFELPEQDRIVFAPGKRGGDITVAEKINGDMWNEERLKKGDEPRIKIFATCPMMIWELSKLRYKDWSGSMQEQRNLQESIVDKDNHSYDDLRYFLTMFFMAPAAPKEEKLAKLKAEDPVSYQEWRSVERLHGRERSLRGTMGDFEGGGFSDDTVGGW